MSGSWHPAWILGTWFGTGFSPKAPGTVGTLAALPLQWALLHLPVAAHWGAVALVAFVGVWAAQRVSDDSGSKDPQIVVIDEVSGVLIAMTMVRSLGLDAQLMAVVLFRIFDITKPGPVKRVERLKPAGVGIMADDWLAGVMSGVVAFALATLM